MEGNVDLWSRQLNSAFGANASCFRKQVSAKVCDPVVCAITQRNVFFSQANAKVWQLENCLLCLPTPTPTASQKFGQQIRTVEPSLTIKFRAKLEFSKVPPSLSLCVFISFAEQITGTKREQLRPGCYYIFALAKLQIKCAAN